MQEHHNTWKPHRFSRSAANIIQLPGCPWGSFSQLLAWAIFDSITARDLLKASISWGEKGKHSIISSALYLLSYPWGLWNCLIIPGLCITNRNSFLLQMNAADRLCLKKEYHSRTWIPKGKKVLPSRAVTFLPLLYPKKTIMHSSVWSNYECVGEMMQRRQDNMLETRPKSKGKAFPAESRLYTLKRKCSIHSINYGCVWT